MIFVFLWQFQTYCILLDERDRPRYELRSEDVRRFQNWVTMEVVLVVGIALSNICYLLVRSQIRNELILSTEDYTTRKITRANNVLEFGE